jgi:hypothetical protein
MKWRRTDLGTLLCWEILLVWGWILLNYVSYHLYHICLYSNSDIVASGSDHRLLATVTFEYSSQQEGELSLRVGDVINDVTEVTSRARGVNCNTIPVLPR